MSGKNSICNLTISIDRNVCGQEGSDLYYDKTEAGGIRGHQNGYFMQIHQRALPHSQLLFSDFFNLIKLI
jgi:hypothetical protein